MQQQKKNAESNNKHFARRNHIVNKGKPYIEYTRNNDDDEFASNSSANGATPALAPGK